MQALTAKYKPSKISDFAGLDKARAVMTHLSKSPYSSAWLFVGESGTGKTSMAVALAAAIKAEVVHIASAECNKERVMDLLDHCACVPMFAESGWYVVIVDEADRMTKEAQIAFLSVLDGTRMPANTIIVFTANETEKLEDRFLSRVRKIEFKSDQSMELAAVQLLERIWKSETKVFAKATPPNFSKILIDAGSNVRTAVNELELEIMALESKIYTPAPSFKPVAVGA